MSDSRLLWEMANITPDQTGLRYVVWASVSMGQHACRIKVCLTPKSSARNFTVTVPGKIFIGEHSQSISTKDRSDIERFVELNAEALLEFWKENISTRQLLDRLVPIDRENI